MRLRRGLGRLQQLAVWAFIAISGLLGSCHRLPDAGVPAGRVVRILDGDTIEVLLGGRAARVRLYGVDCPEAGQPYAAAARRFTGELCFGRRVTLRSFGSDRYGRLLAEVILPDGRILNHELLRAGLAWWYREYAPHQSGLAALEAGAREARRGLWAESRPLPPWEFRRAGRSRGAPVVRPDGK